MEFDWVEDYLGAKLAEIETALATLDQLADAADRHADRKTLVDAQTRVIAALANYSAQPPALN